MADKLLRSIKFPTLPDRYVIGDSTLTEEGAAAEAKAVGDALATKADTKGTYEDLIVGGAEQLMADEYETDKEPYLFRTTGGSADVGNREYLDSIVGGTVAWNQLADTQNGQDAANQYAPMFNLNGNVDVVSGHKYLVSFVQHAGCAVYRQTSIRPGFPVTYKSYAAPSVNTRQDFLVGATDTASYNMGSLISKLETTEESYHLSNQMLFDLTQMFGSTIADYIYSLEQSQAGAGVAWFRQYFPKDYYPYDPGTLRSVEGVSAHETVGFNAFDVANADLQQKDWKNVYTDSHNVHTEGYTKVIAGATYCFHQNIETQGRYIRFYDADYNFLGSETISIYDNNDHIFTVPANAMYLRIMWYDANDVFVAEVENGEITINLSDPTRNGEYEPYQKHTYPLDSSLTLRGVPKLDASNNLYYDGDTYASDGTVTRKYGVVDLGTLNYTYNPSYGFITQGLSSVIKNASGYTENGNLICSKYITYNYNDITAGTTDKCIGVSGGNYGYVVISDSLYTNAETFKTAMSGVYLVYELATPTTETAEGYDHYQICDPSGTEEFVTTGIVPVGHETRYPHDLKKKIETAPDSPSTDGTYLMKRSGGKNTYMALPSTPSANGAYVLTVTVSGGTASYSWTAKE